MKFKGIVFPSWNQPRREDKQVKVWHPHQNVGQRVRLLRQKCRPLLNSKEVEVAVTGQRIIDVVKARQEKEPDTHVEYAVLVFMSSGMDLALETGVSWVSAMNGILDKAERAREKKITVRYRDEEADGTGEPPTPANPESTLEAQPDGQGGGTPQDEPSEAAVRGADVQRD